MALSLEAEGTCAQTPNVKNCPLLPLQTGSGPRPLQTPPPENYRRIFLAAILGTAKQRKNIMPNKKKKKRGEKHDSLPRRFLVGDIQRRPVRRGQRHQRIQNTRFQRRELSRPPPSKAKALRPC